MPIHCPPITRRRFLSSAAVTAAGLLTIRPSAAAGDDSQEVDLNYFVLLADSHIDQNPSRLLRGVNPAENLDLAVKRILKIRPRPAAVILNGDAANIRGLPGEYGLFSWIIRAIPEAGIPLHITLGNHDDREPFYSIMQDMKPDEPLIEDRHVTIVETPHVYLFLLDTLDQVNNTPGLLGERQLEWLEDELERHTDKPVILIGHHYPDTGNGRGLLDIDKLYETALSHDHVKAYFYGHSHRWEIGKHKDLHLVNQPATAHVFQQEQPQAYVHARFHADEVQLELDCLDRGHDWHGQAHTLVYR